MLKSDSLTEKQLHGRVENALLEFLKRRLVLPKVYFEIKWANWRPDVTAIDRSGSGDVHVLEITSAAPSSTTVAKLLRTPAHFKYLIIPESAALRLSAMKNFVAPDGRGVIGILAFSDPGQGPIRFRILQEPERFVPGEKVWELADEFVQKNNAAYEYRG